MSFPSEQEAFAAYARIYPDNCILLIDTYDTLRSGLPHAITTGRELKAQGRKGFGVRLDSGNLSVLAQRVRTALNKAGLQEASIIVSGDLDEYAIARLQARGVPIDAWGVGTRLVTGHPDGALTGVYKLVAREADGRMTPVKKFSDSREKATLAGAKQVYRVTDADGVPRADILYPTGIPFTPRERWRAFRLRGNKLQWVKAQGGGAPLLTPVMKNGEINGTLPPLPEIRERTLAELARFDPAVLRLRRPASYPVLVSPSLRELNAPVWRRYRIKGVRRS